MQNDLISRSALLKDFAERQELDRSGGDYADCFMNSAQTLSTEWWCVEDAVESAPTIDAVPVVHARWVHEQRYGDSGGWVWRCKACRREAISPIISALKYCHCCGAKMDGGAEDVWP